VKAPEFWRHGGLVPALLAPLAWGYDAACRANRALVSAQRAPVPVVCVGNLVVGGAGKTPVALALGARLAALGHDVHFLSRGYGGRARGPLRVEPGRHDAREVGDEPLLLAACRPTWVARDRAAGARAAAAAGAEVVVMDDGFQNGHIAKDLSLLVVDGAYGFGNRRPMPAGPLREDVRRGLARADAAVLLGADEAGVAARIEAAGLALLRATIAPTLDAVTLTDRPVVAFAGIARPEKFFATLEALGCRPLARRAFADHHRYDADEIMELVELAAREGATLVTTEKDHVRLPEAARPMVEVLRVRLEWAETAVLDRLLAPLFEGG
jgi:tetraacyldisaccharide 4'-kinase